MTATGRKAPNSRPVDRQLARINIEVYPDEETLIRQVKMIAALKGITFHTAVMTALQEWVEKV